MPAQVQRSHQLVSTCVSVALIMDNKAVHTLICQLLFRIFVLRFDITKFQLSKTHVGLRRHGDTDDMFKAKLYASLPDRRWLWWVDLHFELGCLRAASTLLLRRCKGAGAFSSSNIVGKFSSTKALAQAKSEAMFAQANRSSSLAQPKL